MRQRAEAEVLALCQCNSSTNSVSEICDLIQNETIVFSPSFLRQAQLQQKHGTFVVEKPRDTESGADGEEEQHKAAPAQVHHLIHTPPFTQEAPV